MVSEETMMFRFGADENKAENIIKSTCSSMEKKGYNGRIYYFNHRMVYTLNQANKPVKYMEYTLYGYREVEVA